ncbi:SinR family protein [Chryseobacterium shandongense]|uniref:SinR family protein n=1 Tax=Chryseobacterium shandongense TaxID=1493872 RepID=UPI000F4FEB27|nr:SinR family protein [Chryseobacterium shandongense]AZA56263.1 SinR family protein [Chryseobacterium shandongense]
MKTYLIGYDLNKQGQDYETLIEKIKEFADDWWHCLDSTWIIRSESNASEIIDFLIKYVDDNDELLVVLLDKEIAWRLPTECSDWLQQYFTED